MRPRTSGYQTPNSRKGAVLGVCIANGNTSPSSHKMNWILMLVEGFTMKVTEAPVRLRPSDKNCSTKPLSSQFLGAYLSPCRRASLSVGVLRSQHHHQCYPYVRKMSVQVYTYTERPEDPDKVYLEQCHCVCQGPKVSTLAISHLLAFWAIVRASTRAARQLVIV
jgi:hypothetical protein